MRTRTHGLASPPLSSPGASDKQRKRTAPSPSPSPLRDELSDDKPDIILSRINYDMVTTPSRPAKRVRFSDLGPELLSSGLTPGLRRATISPRTSTFLTKTTPRNKSRASLSPSLPSPSSSPLPPIIQHITPLRQTLDDRSRRRLRRSHLSEEVNDYEHEHRADVKARHQLAQLRDEDAKKEQRIETLMWELEMQRQFGIELNDQEEDDIQTLRKELAELKGEVAAVQPKQKSSALPDVEDEVEPLANDTFDEATPWEEETFFSSPSGYLHRSTTSSSSVCTETLDLETTDQCCQVSMTDHDEDAQVQALKEVVGRLTQDSADAKAAVDILRGELRTLGFSTEENDSADGLITTVRDAFRKARLDLEYLLPGETQGGLEDGKLLLESFLVHIKTLLDKLRSQDKIIDRQSQAESALRGQFNGVLEKLANAEQSFAEIISHRTDLIAEVEQKEQALEALRDEMMSKHDQSERDRHHIQELEAARQESSISIERLQAALQSYREEVTSLESLITTMEEEKLTLSGTVKNLEGANKELEAKTVELGKDNQDRILTHNTRITQLLNNLEVTKQELTTLTMTLEDERRNSATKLSDARQQLENLETKWQDKYSEFRALQAKYGETNSDLNETRLHLASHVSQVQGILTSALQGYRHVREASEQFLKRSQWEKDSTVVMGDDGCQHASDGVEDDDLLTLAVQL